MNQAEYELTKINDLGNFNIKLENKFLGRLYLFPVTESELLAAGIKTKWFLTHQQGDFVVTGHINQAGEWSLSLPKSLTPRDEYHSRDEVFNTIFSDDYVEMILGNLSINQPLELMKNQSLSQNSNDRSQKSSDSLSKQDDHNSEDESPSDAVKANKSITENLSEIYVNKNIKVENSWGLNEGKELESEPDYLEESDFGQKIEEGEALTDKVEILQITEAQRKKLEQQLKTIIIEGHKQKLLDLDNQDRDSYWILELDSESESFRLSAKEDGRTVMAISLSGDILSNLSAEDAQLLSDRILENKQLTDLDKQEISTNHTSINQETNLVKKLESMSNLSTRKQGWELE